MPGPTKRCFSQVHGTVRSLTNPVKVDHLKSLPGAAERLHLFESDLLKPDSFEEAFAGCEGIFHTASPFFFATTDPENDLLKPAYDGTMNVLNAAKRAGVKTLILTSSMAAVMGKEAPADHVWSAKDWSDPERQLAKEQWYLLSKTRAELAAWEWHEKEGEPFRMAVINPTLVSGPMAQPSMNESSGLFEAFVTGKRDKVPDGHMSFVDVRDTAELHVRAYENEAASGTRAAALADGTGRYITVASSVSWKDAVAALKAALPEDLAARVPVFEGDVSGTASEYDTTPATGQLGVTWRSPVEQVADLARCPVFLAAVRESLKE